MRLDAAFRRQGTATIAVFPHVDSPPMTYRAFSLEKGFFVIGSGAAKRLRVANLKQYQDVVTELESKGYCLNAINRLPLDSWLDV